MGEKLHAGVIGLGILGSQHARFLHDQPQVQVDAVVDLIEPRAQAVAAEMDALAYADYADMFSAHCLDLVVVATPDHLHKEPILAAVQAGIPNIIQEKPLATVLADAREMLDAADQARSRIFINYANRGSAFDRATYYVLQQGLLGQVVYGEINLDDNICVPTRMWGSRTQEWVSGSSTAHFLLSHVVDFIHWVLSPSRVKEVYAISQRQVLGYTPDLYDAFLTFDNGARIRVKAEWIKHIDSLVEFGIAFSGEKGSLFYTKRPGFGAVEGWRANVSDQVSTSDLLAHQDALREQGVNVRALVHQPEPVAGELKAGGGTIQHALEAFELPQDWWRVEQGFIDAIIENTLTPLSWKGYGPLPTGIDGWRQAQVVNAIIESAEQNRVISLSL